LAGAAGSAQAGRDSEVWTSHGVMPARTVGKLFFRTPRGDSSCTATVITAPNRRTIWTAGHCVADGEGTWYSLFRFHPDRLNGASPYGAWDWRVAAAPRGWTTARNHGYDLAAIALAPVSGRGVADLVGSQGYRFGGPYKQDVHVFGYPGELRSPLRKVNSELLRYCTGETWKIGTLRTHLGVSCNMGRGSSGGPWLADLQLARGWGYLVGNVSTGASDVYAMRSPHLGDAAINVYNLVKDR
jgi:V8-like Glu-specific endopeptidase